MLRATWTMRLGFLGAVVSIAALGTAAATVAQSGAAPAVTGVHANEELCKTMIRQFELFTQFAKIDLLDMTKRAKFFADQKALNATLVKTAPASLASDVALQTKHERHDGRAGGWQRDEHQGERCRAPIAPASRGVQAHGRLLRNQGHGLAVITGARRTEPRLDELALRIRDQRAHQRRAGTKLRCSGRDDGVLSP